MANSELEQLLKWLAEAPQAPAEAADFMHQAALGFWPIAIAQHDEIAQHYPEQLPTLIRLARIGYQSYEAKDVSDEINRCYHWVELLKLHHAHFQQCEALSNTSITQELNLAEMDFHIAMLGVCFDCHNAQGILEQFEEMQAIAARDTNDEALQGRYASALGQMYGWLRYQTDYDEEIEAIREPRSLEMQAALLALELQFPNNSDIQNAIAFAQQCDETDLINKRQSHEPS